MISKYKIIYFDYPTVDVPLTSIVSLSYMEVNGYRQLLGNRNIFVFNQKKKETRKGL